MILPHAPAQHYPATARTTIDGPWVVNPIVEAHRSLTWWLLWLDTRHTSDASPILARYYRAEREWNEFMARGTEWEV